MTSSTTIGQSVHVAAETEHYARPMLHLVAPLVVIGAGFALRSILNGGYRAVVGSPPPDAGDRAVSWKRALLWTAATSATTAIVEVAIIRFANRPGA